MFSVKKIKSFFDVFIYSKCASNYQWTLHVWCNYVFIKAFSFQALTKHTAFSDQQEDKTWTAKYTVHVDESWFPKTTDMLWKHFRQSTYSFMGHTVKSECMQKKLNHQLSSVSSIENFWNFKSLIIANHKTTTN